MLHRVCDNPVVTMLFEIKAGRSFIFRGIPSSLKCRHRFLDPISSESISLKGLLEIVRDCFLCCADVFGFMSFQLLIFLQLPDAFSVVGIDCQMMV